MKHLRTIRWRIAAWAAGLSLLALSLLAGYFYYRMVRNLDRQIERFVEEEVHEAEAVLAVGDANLIEDLSAEESAHDRAGIWFVLRDGDGAELFRSSALKPGDLAFTGEMRELLRSNRRTWSSESVQSRYARMRTTKYEFADGRTRYFQAAFSESVAAETRETFLGQLLLAVVPFVLLALLGGFFVARRATAPIDDIAAAAVRIQSTGLGERIKLRGTGDELDQLAVVLNETWAALEESFRRVRDFSASASHQLKTPLTVIRGEAELLLRDRPDDPDIARFAVIADEAARLARMVDQLLFLARADAEHVAVALAPVELKTLVEAGFRRIEPYVTVKKLKVTTKLDGAPDALGNDSLLGTAVQNLLDNAAKYAPEGGRLRVGWEAVEAIVALEIENDGKEIPAAERESIMQRFSSAGDRPGQGAGLGLAVAREIAVLHKGRLVALDPRDGMGVRFRLEIPRA
ncbi:MAG: integral membrane sensor signal transduction histidine [Planctomycetota bacterium]|nr:MAG: integral membrane sensor signal transduction histidine [Planctomycetota bacterium]